MRRFLVLLVIGGLGLLVGCGGGGGSTPVGAPITISLAASTQSLSQGSSLNITAALSNDTTNKGVTWSVSGGGTLSNETATSVTYQAPASVAVNTPVVVTATAVADNTVVVYIPLTVLPSGVVANVTPISVDGGPVATQIYPDGSFATAIICAPGTTTCTTVTGLLVDTGSVGLRVLASAMPALPVLQDSSGNTVNECSQFLDGSFLFGNVAVADVRIGGEVAGSISLQAVADPTGFAVPSDCSTNGTGIDEDTQLALGANGILGVGPFPQDCGTACDPSAGGAPPGPAYYACSSSSCAATFLAIAQQVTHPATFFPTDNNGVIVTFPPPGASSEPSLDGSLIFGIGTQSNNALSATANIYVQDANGLFTTTLLATGQTLNQSFIDSGSNGFFFPDDSITTCADMTSFFCPASLTALTTVNLDGNNVGHNYNFSIDNADTLFANSPNDAAFSTLGGPNGTGTCTGNGSCSFDFGLPFFFGNTVYTSIAGQAVPTGAPAAPWWAY